MPNRILPLISVLRQALPTAIGYSVYIILMFWLEYVSPSGPCTPGAGLIMFFFLPIIAAIGLLVSLVRALRVKQLNYPVAIQHFLVLLGTLLFLSLN